MTSSPISSRLMSGLMLLLLASAGSAQPASGTASIGTGATGSGLTGSEAPADPGTASSSVAGAFSSPDPAVGSEMPILEARHHWAPLSPAARSVVAANRAATQEPSSQAFINATQIFPYSEGALFHLYTAPGQISDVVLEAGESLLSIAAGDTARWVIGDTISGTGESRHTHVLIKPFATGLSTNVVISTDRRVYHLSLTSTVKTAMASISWTYPQDQMLVLKHSADEAVDASPTATGLDINKLHFGYSITGDRPDWRPLRAFDDGQKTFVEFPADLANGTAPPLFVIGADKNAELVNYRVHGRYYIVDRLFDAAELRFGLKHQDVVRISRDRDAGRVL